tara:strand:+ start:369 stop:620 length:252 start_codon:yes stop_codon:yes gene_type:complete
MPREKSIIEKWRDWRLDESIPNYFRGYVSNIDSSLVRLDKNVKQFARDLGKDGMKAESMEMQKLYKNYILEFKAKFENLKRKM